MTESSNTSGDLKDRIERVLLENGATAFMYGWENGVARISFIIDKRRYIIDTKLPDPKDFEKTPQTGRKRAPEVALKEWQNAQRETWRDLLTLISAKLNAVKRGVSKLEWEFMAATVLPTGEMVGDMGDSMIENAYSEQPAPKILVSKVPDAT